MTTSPKFGDVFAGTLLTQRDPINRAASVIVTPANAGVQKFRAERGIKESGFRLPPE